MTRYWVVALIVGVVALLFVVRRITRQPEADDERRTLERAGAFGDEHHDDDSGDLDDTAPAVLSPPESAAPKSAPIGRRR